MCASGMPAVFCVSVVMHGRQLLAVMTDRSGELPGPLKRADPDLFALI